MLQSKVNTRLKSSSSTPSLLVGVVALVIVVSVDPSVAKLAALLQLLLSLTLFSLLAVLLLDAVQQLVRQLQRLDVGASHIVLGHGGRVLAGGRKLLHLLERQIHPVVALEQVPPQGLARLELHEHGLALCCVEK